MTPYEKYKPSGVEWIGDVPEHWEVKRGDSIFVLSKNIAKQTGLNGQQVFHYSIPVIQETGTGTIEDGDTVDSDKFILEGNEILFSKLNPRKGTVVISQKHELLTIASTEFVILKPKKDDIKFLFYFLKSNGFQDSVCSVVQSATRSHQRANPVDIYKNKILLPPLPEQTAIARYLDQKTTEIDQLIAQKERLLALWEEEKTALINQAVTRGLDAGAKMKDSGVAWLGEVPEHWEVVKFNHYVKLRHGYQFRDFDFVEKGIKIIKITQLLSNGILETENVSYIDQERLSEFNDILIGSGDILMALTGGTIGKIVRAKEIVEPLLQNYRVGNFFPANKKLTKDFLFFILSSDVIIKQIFYEIRETGQPNIGKEDFNRMYFAFPQEVSEQAAIVRHIETQTARIQTQTDQTRKLIELLKEYRATLISEVVTGKVKITDGPSSWYA